MFKWYFNARLCKINTTKSISNTLHICSHYHSHQQYDSYLHLNQSNPLAGYHQSAAVSLVESIFDPVNASQLMMQSPMNQVSIYILFWTSEPDKQSQKVHIWAHSIILREPLLLKLNRLLNFICLSTATLRAKCERSEKFWHFCVASIFRHIVHISHIP